MSLNQISLRSRLRSVSLIGSRYHSRWRLAYIAPGYANLVPYKETDMRLLALLCGATALMAQPPSRVATGYESIRPERLKADLTFLSSDPLEGRRSLQPGSEIA